MGAGNLNVAWNVNTPQQTFPPLSVELLYIEIYD